MLHYSIVSSRGSGFTITNLIHYYDHVFIVFTSLFFQDQINIFVKNLILKATICKAPKRIKVMFSSDIILIHFYATVKTPSQLTMGTKVPNLGS